MGSTAVGVIVAPRQVETAHLTIESLARSGFTDISTFCEPGEYSIRATLAQKALRPRTIAPFYDLVPDPATGRFGNFQNYVQTLRDLVALRPLATKYMLVEDDALFCLDLALWLDKSAWGTKWGCLSLYCPNLKGYKTGHNITDAKIHTVDRVNHVGCLATVFSPESAAAILQQPTTDWTGNKHQTNVPLWERSACDAWLGQAVRAAGRVVKVCSPSLVLHYCPPELYDVGNSSVGNRAHNGPRQAFRFIGTEASVFSFFSPF